ncbi:hypothetical protein L596_001612 [Steinernema carpocapsae]|uniref:Uncharacterized protein n=1 Tax=Steinernema carpocapsae TaxID=34508 RepID=A0A4U8UQN4_STECR|nr:hypothetical protein L596_001612 [Steinernema carpocapsae]
MFCLLLPQQHLCGTTEKRSFVVHSSSTLKALTATINVSVLQLRTRDVNVVFSYDDLRPQVCFTKEKFTESDQRGPTKYWPHQRVPLTID